MLCITSFDALVQHLGQTCCSVHHDEGYEGLVMQVLTNYLLQWHVNWAMVTPDITDLSMRWLYALLAQIQKPVALESSSQLSKLLRHCIKVRGQITDSNDVRLLSLHMLTALAGGYFGQDRALAACMQSGWV